VYLLLFGVCAGALKASGFTLFNWSMSGTASQTSSAQKFLFGVVGVLSYPMAWLVELFSLPDNRLTMNCTLLLNSIVWGLGLGLLFYRVRRRDERNVA
jgi:hypothetical protein